MWAWRLGALWGIDLKIHVTFPLVLVWAAFQFGTDREPFVAYALFGVVLVVLLFLCVMLHELAHALVARLFHIPVDEIILLPIGGLAKLRAMHDDPLEEFAIAIAGPLVNMAIAVLLFPLVLLFTDLLDPGTVSNLARRTGGSEWRAMLLLLGRTMQNLSLAGALVYLFFANIMLTIFNLLPAFPMDGGRVLRALLAFVLPYRWATIIAVRLSQFLALGLILLGIRASVGLALVGLFVLLSGGPELRRMELREILTRGKIGAYMMRALYPLYPQWNLHAARLLARQTGQLVFPVVEGNQLLGLLTVRELHGLRGQENLLTVGDAMVRDYIVLPPAGSLYDAQLTLQGGDQYAAAVMEEGQLLGLLSLEDIEQAYRSLAQQPRVRVA